MAKGKRTALITGSNKNIGSAIALHLAETGHNIVVNGSRDKAACEEVAGKVRALGAEALIALGDIGDRKAVDAMARAPRDLRRRRYPGEQRRGAPGRRLSRHQRGSVAADHGHQLLFRLPPHPRLPAGHDRQGLGPHRQLHRHDGAAGLSGEVGGGQRLQARALGADEIAVARVRAQGRHRRTSSRPGTFPASDADPNAPRFETLRKANPTGRLGVPDDIAAMVDLLVSEQGGFINGQMLQINGGVVNQF